MQMMKNEFEFVKYTSSIQDQKLRGVEIMKPFYLLILGLLLTQNIGCIKGGKFIS